MARCFSESCFESFSNGCSNLSGNITAAATTGPERQPLPASSVPASNFNPEKLSCNMFLKNSLNVKINMKFWQNFIKQLNNLFAVEHFDIHNSTLKIIFIVNFTTVETLYILILIKVQFNVYFDSRLLLSYFTFQM